MPLVTREQRRHLARENLKFPPYLVRVENTGPMIELWRSRHFLLQVFDESHRGEYCAGMVRLTVNRTDVDQDGRWLDNITWDDMQRLKRECGRGDNDAVEIFPRDVDLVNVANMRHLWVLPIGRVFGFGWRAPRPAAQPEGAAHE
jgi:hypothetical protein